MGAGWLGLAKRKARGGDDDVDLVGVSIGERVTAELVFDSLKFGATNGNETNRGTSGIRRRSGIASNQSATTAQDRGD
jgi:hypothetical protein